MSFRRFEDDIKHIVTSITDSEVLDFHSVSKLSRDCFYYKGHSPTTT